MTEGIWLSTSFPPEAEGVYQRRNPHGAKMLDFQWDGEYWRLDGEWRNYHQSGEYLLPAGAWAVTKGVRPPLSDDVQVRWGLRDGFQDSVYSLSAGQLAWSFIGRFRLAPALKPKCDQQEALCEIGNAGSASTSGANASSSQPEKNIAGLPASVADSAAASTSLRDRFGLKWPAEPRSRMALGTAHATYFKEWK